MTQRFIILYCSALAAGCSSQGGDHKQAEKKNILFISVDDLRPELECYGTEGIQTPNFNRLARQGVIFTRAYCQSAICMPSRASLLSGIRPEHFDTTGRLNARPMDENLPGILSLPGHMKAEGYETVSVGKVYHYNHDDPDGWTRRYETTFGEEERSHGYCSGYQSRRNIELLANYVKALTGSESEDLPRPPAVECVDAPDILYPDGKITGVVVRELDNFSKSGRPFFIAAGYYRPHLPFTPPEKYWDLYDRDGIGLADNPFLPVNGLGFTNWGELRRYGDIPNQGPLSNEKARELIHGYYASVSFIDAQLGILMDALRRLGLDRNTAIILWGDHGWNLGEHGLWCKHTNFEVSVRTALMVSVPGYAKGKKTDALTGLIDVYPTICDIAGIRKPEHLEGTSFLPVIRDPDIKWKNAVYSLYFDSYSMRTARYRFTRYFEPKPFRNTGREGKGIYELYDHANDPAENRNIAYDPANRELIGMLEKQMDAFLE